MKTISWILGVNYSHDRSACLLKNGRIFVAIEEERLDRIKHSVGFIFEGYLDNLVRVSPMKSINYCLEYANISIDDIELIVVNSAMGDNSIKIAIKEIPIKDKSKICSVPLPSHHLLHAYSSYFSSGFDNAGVIVVDSYGSYLDHNQDSVESESFFRASGTVVEKIKSSCFSDNKQTLSLGLFYSYFASMLKLVTKIGNEKFGTFECGGYAEAGKLMGLAAYGKEREDWEKIISYSNDKISIEIPRLHRLYNLWKMIDIGNDQKINYDQKFYRDIAYKAQQELEEALLFLVNKLYDCIDSENLCISGGVGLNALANMKLVQNSKFKNIYIYPACCDSGIAVGCAYYGYFKILNHCKVEQNQTVFWGKDYSKEDIMKALNLFSEKICWRISSDEEIAKKIADGSIVGYFNGRSEFGPRALGHRSILADPRDPNIREILNRKVKMREPFRPFAPSVLWEHAKDYFEITDPLPFMTVVVNVRDDKKSIIPSVVHNDGTARIQTVHNESRDIKYYKLIEAFYSITGVPIILNTSFNKHEPIVETPDDAINTFLNTQLDYLVLDDILVERKK